MLQILPYHQQLIKPIRVAGAYLHVELGVNLDGFAEDVHVLHEGGKLPHVPKAIQCLIMGLCLFDGDNAAVQVGLLAGALPSGHLFYTGAKPLD